MLPEEDWQALRAIEPDAVGWLHTCIRQRLGAGAPGESAVPPQASSVDGWGDDEY